MTGSSQGHPPGNRPPGDEVARARLLTELGRYEQAEGLLRRLLDSQPDHLGARRQLAALLLKADRYDDLLQLAEQALAGSPEDGEFHFYRGFALIGLRDCEAAVTTLREALRLRTDDQRTHGALIAALVGTGRRQEALEVAQECARRWPDHKFSHLAMMAGLAVMDRFEEGEAAGLRAMAADPGFVPGRSVLAEVRLRHGKWAEARADILAVLRAEPDRKNLLQFEREIRRVGNPAGLADVYQMIQAALGQGSSPGGESPGGEGTGPTGTATAPG